MSIPNLVEDTERETATTLAILPPDVWWLLDYATKYKREPNFNMWMLWHWQFFSRMVSE